MDRQNDEENVNQIVSFLKNAPSPVKKFLTKMMITGSLGMKKMDQEMFQVQDIGSNSDHGKMEQQRRLGGHLQDFKDGIRNEQYVNYFYQVIKKADQFILNSTPEEIKKALTRAAVNGVDIDFGVESDNYDIHKKKTDRQIEESEAQLKSGLITEKEHRNLEDNLLNDLRNNHFNEHDHWFGKKHVNYGKTIKQVNNNEINKRVTPDDPYPVDQIFFNEPTLTNPMEAAQASEKPKYDFPLRVVRNADIINKIEQLVEYVHIKSITSEYKLIEFLIPEKFSVGKYGQDSDVFKDLVKIEQIRFRNLYGEEFAYSITGFDKYIHMKNYDVIKFKGNKIEMI